MRGGVRTFVLVLLVGAGIFFLWRVFLPNPEKVIRKRLAELAAVASFGPNEAPLAKLANAQAVAGYFTGDVELSVEVPGRSQAYVLSGREDLSQAVMAARSQLTSLGVEFPDIAVALRPDRLSAVADVTVRGRIGNDRDAYLQEMKFTLVKRGGEWLVSRLETVKTLR